MKKYVILVCVSLTLILTVLATGYNYISDIEYTSAMRVEKTLAKESLIYTGLVEYSNASTCTSKGNGMVQSVLVNNGDFVSEGDPIVIAYETESEIPKSDIMSAITANNYDLISSILESNSTLSVYEAKTSGIISSLNLDGNSLYQKGQTLYKISPENSFQIQVNVTENDISKVEIGQTVLIECKAVSNTLKGVVKGIDKSAKQTSTGTGKETTVKVIIQIEDDCEEIKSGYTASCSINISEKADTLLLPYSAVATDENGVDYVYLYKNGTVVKHTVNCGKEYNNGIEIKKGLSEGDIVISDLAEVKDISRAIVNEVAPYEK